MRKIPTLFERDEATNRRHVRNAVTPGCEWVLEGKGVATRKLDGTCVLIRGGVMHRRHEVKPGKTPPPGFELVETDEVTGKSVGWVRVGDGPDDRWHREAIDPDLPDGTYELLGPRINKNPEGMDRHVLRRHGVEVLADEPRSFEELQAYLTAPQFIYEGIVWHWMQPDGTVRMAKLKRRDFPAVTS